MDKLYVQYGCGFSNPDGWINFDASPTLRIQKIPIIGALLKNKSKTIFPGNIRYGDIIKGLPIKDDACAGLYCSHTLEHLSLSDFKETLKNSYKILKPGGIFRCVVPDLEYCSKQYSKNLDDGDASASLGFMRDTMLGVEARPMGLKGFIIAFFGNSNHLWMWDAKSLSEELKKAGFIKIRACRFNDCEDVMFKRVEDPDRFENAVALECRK